MEEWLYTPHTTIPAADILAAGDALLSTADDRGIPAMRWYSVARPALILGRGQAQTHVDAPACQQASIAVHRRTSGGTAVLMTPDLLMLDMAIPTGHRLYSADVTHSYRWFGEVWVAALQKLGIAGRMLDVAEAREDTAQLDPLVRRVCFGGFSPYEIVVAGDERKLVGFAQVRRHMGALLQAGVYRQWQPALLAGLLSLAPHERDWLTAQLAARATGLLDHLSAIPLQVHTPSLVAQVIAAWDGAVQAQQGVRLCC